MRSDAEFVEEDNAAHTSYFGKDGTKWGCTPYNTTPSLRPIKGGVNTVKLPPCKYIESIVDDFSLF